MTTANTTTASTKTATSESCPRCNGQGYGGWRPHNGICYRCWGLGRVLTSVGRKTRRVEWLKAALKSITKHGQKLAKSSDPADIKAVAALRVKYATIRGELRSREKAAKKAVVSCPPLTEDSHTVMMAS